MKTVLITGATGLIGKAIVEKLRRENIRTIILSTNKNKAQDVLSLHENVYNWDVNKGINDQPDNWAEQINSVDAIINLAGDNLIGRWTKKKKEKIISSRIKSTKLLYDAVDKSHSKPSVFIGASAIGFYGDTKDEAVDENSPKGEGFLADLVWQWEKEQHKFETVGVRRVSVRIGVVLDKQGGALGKMLPAFKLFVGGPIGSGKQWMSWIHLKDLVNVFWFAMNNETIEGEINAVSPDPETMKSFSVKLGKTLKRPSLFKIPSFLIKLLMGEASQVVTASTKVIPRKLLDQKFEFVFPRLEEALKDILYS